MMPSVLKLVCVVYSSSHNGMCEFMSWALFALIAKILLKSENRKAHKKLPGIT